MAGLLRAPMGIGSGGRCVHAGLEALGYAPCAADLSGRFHTRGQGVEWGNPEALARADDGQGPIILHLNAPEAVFGLNALGRRTVSGRFLVGYWAWELPVLPKSWRAAARYFHEIWTPSAFTRDAVARALPDTRVLAVGYHVEPATPESGRIAHWREWAGVGDGFMALNMFDARSSAARKNPFGVIAAFQKAMEGRSDAVLVIKVGSRGLHRDIDGRLDALVKGDPRIRLLTETLSEADISALIAASNVLVSLHRSEGYGLPIAQALALGVPVVMTGWSGNADYAGHSDAISIPYSLTPVQDRQGIYPEEGMVWAEPDLDAAAAALRNCAALTLSRKPRKRSHDDLFSAEAFGRRLSADFLHHAVRR